MQLFTFAAYGNAWTALGSLYLVSLGGVCVMFYVAYPKHDQWHRHHAVMHTLSSVGAIAFDLAVRL
nr:hypothetical protein TetV2_00278 [Oceanusvirus sp.]